MPIEKNPALAALAAEAHAQLNTRLREFAEWAGLVCASCELSCAVVVRAVGNGRGGVCKGPASPIRADVRTVEEYDALEAARLADANFSFSGNRCPVYQAVGDGYITYREA